MALIPPRSPKELRPLSRYEMSRRTIPTAGNLGRGEVGFCTQLLSKLLSNANWPRKQKFRRCRIYVQLAEGVGFEPTVDVTAYNGFQDRRLQPLSHPSAPDIKV